MGIFGAVFGGEAPSGGGSGDTTPPSIINVTPAVGQLAPTYAAAVNTPVQFDVVDLAPGLRIVVVTIKLITDGGAGTNDTTLVVHDGSAFLWPYVANSERTAIANGYHFRILPTGGWPPNVKIHLFAYALDQAGNMEGNLP